MKKKIFLVIVIMLLSSVTALAVWQWDNIIAVVDGIRYDDEQIALKATSSAEKVDKYFEENQLNKVTPMTPEQETALQTGEITAEEAIKIMTGEMTFEEAKKNNKSDSGKKSTIKSDSGNTEKGNDSENTKDSAKASDKNDKSAKKSDTDNKTTKNNTSATGKQDNGENESQNASSDKSANKNDNVKEQPVKDNNGNSGGSTGNTASGGNYDAQISATVAKLYVVKSNFYSQFNSRYNQVRSEFLKRPVSEQTRAHVAATVKSYMSEGLAMERECDAQVEAILSELSGLLRKAGRDQSLVNSIRSAYNSEKSALKSSLINKYF